jgi:hypothetical protein
MGWGGWGTAWSQPFGLLPRGSEPAAIFIHAGGPRGRWRIGRKSVCRFWTFRGPLAVAGKAGTVGMQASRTVGGSRGCGCGGPRASARGIWGARGNPLGARRGARLGCSRRPRAAGNPWGRARASQLGCSPRELSVAAAGAAAVALAHGRGEFGERGGNPLEARRGARFGCSRRPRAAGNPWGRARASQLGCSPRASARGIWRARGNPLGGEGGPRLGTAHFRRLTPPSFAAQNPRGFSSVLMARRVMEAPSKIAFGLWGREGTAHFRRLTPPSFAALKPRRFSSLLMSRGVMEAPSKIAFGLWGREGTAHFRRLTPPSFAAQNPRGFSSVLMARRVMGLAHRRHDGRHSRSLVHSCGPGHPALGREAACGSRRQKQPPTERPFFAGLLTGFGQRTTVRLN